MLLVHWVFVALAVENFLNYDASYDTANRLIFTIPISAYIVYSTW